MFRMRNARLRKLPWEKTKRGLLILSQPEPSISTTSSHNPHVLAR